jgi:hypothetical protein
MKEKPSSQQKQGCLASLLGLIGINRSASKPPDTIEYLSSDPDSADPDPLPYRLRDDFLSPAETSFFQVIKSMMGNFFIICPKVSLADIFFVTRPNENKGAHNRINRKHVDFMICEPQTMAPLFAIELDDSSHDRADRMERDTFVDSVFEAAQLPLLHIPVQRSYNTNELGILFKNTLQKKNISINTAEPIVSTAPPAAIFEPETAETPGESTSDKAQVPFCPKCGSPMVLRTAKNGAQSGRQFYGCANYPKCRVILPFEGAK